MAFLVRKISKAKWHTDGYSEGDPANADAITNCLRTSKNSLSFWSIDSLDQLHDAVLAIVSANDNLDTVDVVIIDEGFFSESGLTVIQTDGNTRCKELVNWHRDLVELDANTLSILASKVAYLVSKGESKRITLAELKRLLSEAIDSGKLEYSKLSPNVQKKLSRRAEDRPSV